jgi:hypothetical protein
MLGIYAGVPYAIAQLSALVGQLAKRRRGLEDDCVHEGGWRGGKHNIFHFDLNVVRNYQHPNVAIVVVVLNRRRIDPGPLSMRIGRELEVVEGQQERRLELAGVRAR